MNAWINPALNSKLILHSRSILSKLALYKAMPWFNNIKWSDKPLIDRESFGVMAEILDVWFVSNILESKPSMGNKHKASFHKTHSKLFLSGKKLLYPVASNYSGFLLKVETSFFVLAWRKSTYTLTGVPCRLLSETWWQKRNLNLCKF